MSEQEITPEAARKEWAKDLRTGDYKQIKGHLRDKGNGRCCLGVACDTYKRLTGKGDWCLGIFYDAEGDRAHYALPAAVRNFYGFSLPDPILDPDRNATAVGLNDLENKSFSEIADLVEKYE